MKTAACFAALLVLPMFLCAGNLKEKSTPEDPIRNVVFVGGESSSGSDKIVSSPAAASWKITNISQKRIVAFVQTVSIHSSGGQVREHGQEYEEFFYTQTFEPGDSIDLSRRLGQWAAEAGRPQDAPPPCEVTLRWVEFADGTTFGDPDYARELLARRERVLSTFLHLSHVYEQQGAEQFERELQEHISPPLADSFIEDLRERQKKDGTQATVDRLKMLLRTAEERGNTFLPKQ
jgi:hypothetical protein